MSPVSFFFILFIVVMQGGVSDRLGWYRYFGPIGQANAGNGRNFELKLLKVQYCIRAIVKQN